jgi:superfamily II DNA/RNA helicase
MPTFGKSNARAPKSAAAGRKPRHTHADKTKTREDAMGRSSGSSKRREAGAAKGAPHRAESASAPRGKRPSFFEEGSRKTYGTTEAPRSESRDSGRNDRNERPSYGRDRNERPSYGRDERGGRPSAGRTSPREMNGGREDRGRDWSPKSDERPAYGRGSRDDRPSYGRERDRNDRPAYGRDRNERNERPAYGRDRDDRGAARTERPSYGRSDAERFNDRVERRGGFGDRDREARNPNREDRAARDASRESSFRGARDANPNKKAFFEDKVLERLEVEQSEVITEDSFENMGLHPKILAALEGMGATAPFPIQASTIPAAISGRDVLGRGKTGSGKTIAFTVPLVTKLVAGGSQPRKPNKPRALILAPTRELADQIDRTVNGIARPVGFYTVCIYGGVPQRRQEIAMSRGVDIVVATPGRLEDLMAQKIVDLSDVETMVIDEADHMCDLGFIEGVRRIMRAAGDSQKLLFSATLDREVDALVKEFLPDPYVYEVPNEEQDTSNITHRIFTVDQEDRSAVLLRLVQGEGKSLIFTRTKMTAERLSESLTQAGVPAARIHGDLNQNQRNRNLERFIKGNVRVLVATDVAARGIHVDDVKLVIQVDPPEEYKTYLHRSGRTGRGHSSGTVITLIPRSRRRRMEDLLNRAERDGIFSEVRPSSPLLEELAGEIAPPPAPEVLDFGDSRGGGNGGGRGRGDRDGGRGRSGGSRSGGGRSNFGGNGKGRWSDKPSGDRRK